jgi:hypothetical protein
VKFIKRITKPLHPRDEVVFLLPEWARLGVKGGGAVRTFLTILAATVCAVVASIGVHEWYRMRPSEPTIAVWQTSAVPATPTAQPERWSYADLMRLKAKMSEADRQVVADVLRGHTREAWFQQATAQLQGGVSRGDVVAWKRELRANLGDQQAEKVVDMFRKYLQP